MRLLIISATIGLLSPTLVAAPNTTQLTLVDEDGFNELEIRVSALILSDSDTTTLTGFIDASLNIDPANDTTDQFGITDSQIAASDVSLSLSSFFVAVSANINSSGLMGTASTPGGTSPVNPAGEFDASLHEFTINSGTLSGDVNGDPINNDVSETPISGTGQGTGTIILSNPVLGPNWRVDYDVTLILPVSLETEIPTGAEFLGSEIVADVNVTGTIKATGTTYTYRVPDYPEWAAAQSLAGDSQSSFDLTTLMSNQLAHALGFDAATIPTKLLTSTTEGLTFPRGTSPIRQNVTVQYSPDLQSWDTAPSSHFTSGQPNLPPGYLGPITLSPPTNTGYYRFTLTP